VKSDAKKGKEKAHFVILHVGISTVVDEHHGNVFVAFLTGPVEWSPALEERKEEAKIRFSSQNKKKKI
jgi:hypothetical protein